MILVVLILGCQTVCPDWSRLDGFYVVNSDVDSEEPSGQNVDIFLAREFFLLGWSEWNMTYQPAQQELDIDIEEQPYAAELSGGKESCDDFTLTMGGIYLNSDGSERYDFTLTGELSISGPKWTGTATADVDWSLSDGTEGSIHGLNVSMVATQPK